MKLSTGSLSVYHVADGRHRETLTWHDADHKAEVIATVPHIFISQRWVTPPDWMALRPGTPLAHHGGEYFNLYWSSGTPDELDRDFADLGARMTAAGRMRPAEAYMTKVWPAGSSGRLAPLSVQARPGLPTSAEAAVASTAMTALLTVIESVPAAAGSAYRERQEQKYIPAALSTGAFAAAAFCSLLAPGDTSEFVTLYYLDAPDPGAEYRKFTAAGGQAGSAAQAADGGGRLVLESLAAPSIGDYSFYP